MKRKTLPEIAADLREAACTHGQAHATLGRGLRIDVYHRDALWLLWLTRDDVPPGDEEVRTCRRNFHVPDGAVELRTNRLISIVWQELSTNQLPFSSELVATQEALL